ncbi:hypothetical protein [Streptomyces sp. NBC_00198]|uniref:hypothetical protein n=1 Tax=Streptomyces sp. NBC_00198 TaxID=2975677 RepID=UPI002253C16C|nr:hypothetical protein [Streptomyces sp. NBC_00198]MCX5285960.1 hypothetical protein [Streptomyces sp. NBC_00198]MCX5286269.1 hypothetical protein [Streptomyces sp. NBC_00198]
MTAEPDLTELQPLARIIAEKIHTVPVRHCPGGTDELVAELTLAVAIYVSRHVLPPGLPAAVVRPATMSEERAAALLAPLEAKARALGEQRDAEHRAAVLREAADIAESLRQFEHATGARWSAQVSENVGILRVADELRRLADAASGPGQADGETPQQTDLDAVRRIVRRLAAHAAGFQDVLDDSDRGPWGTTVGADIAALQAALGETEQPCDGCDHPTHPALECTITLYGERCACDEPIAPPATTTGRRGDVACSAPPVPDYAQAWTALVAYVQAALDQDKPIRPEDIAVRMRELRHDAMAPTRAWVNQVAGSQPGTEV